MTPTPETAPDPLDGMVSAGWLTGQHFPPVEYVVPGLIPEGLTLLVAPPKVGKSWLVLGIATAAAEGGQALGAIPVDSRPVLYLALEDGHRRLQGRLRTIGVDHGHRDLYFMVDAASGAVPTIAAFVERHAERRPLVILDTLGKVRGVDNGRDPYGRDYSQMSALKATVDAYPGSSLIVVHHTNKGEKSDFLDSVSGTQGLAGAADTILSIQRDRNGGDATLNVTSRDAAEGQYAVTLTDGVWTVDGSDLSEAAQQAEQRRALSGVGDDMARIIELVNEHPEGIGPADVAAQLDMDADTAGRYLRRAVEKERLERAGRGLYTPVRSVRMSGTTTDDQSPSGQTDTTDTPTEGTLTIPCQLHGADYLPGCFTCDQITESRTA